MAVLALSSPKPVLRVQIAGLLWSRREKEQARASLRQSVHELQDSLGPTWHHAFITDRHHLALRAPELDIDAQALSQPGVLSADMLDRCDEPLLEDLNGLDPAFDRWLDDERRRMIRLARQIGDMLLARCDDPAAVIEMAQRLLAVDRTYEGAWRMVIRAHAERGDVGSALGCYDRLRGVLAEFPDMRPSIETEELVERIRTQPQGRAQEPPRPATVAPERIAAPSRDRSSLRLRVAPMRVIGGESDDGLGIGLAEEVSAGLSRFRWISCVPASLWPGGASAVLSSGGLGDVADGASHLPDTDLVLDGTIQRAGKRVRVIVRLIDLRAGGEIVWAGRFDRDFTDALNLQDELGATIVAQVDPELMRHEGRRSVTDRSQDLTARDLLLQALPAIYRLERQTFLSARRLLEMSLEADPTSSVTHGWLAYWYLLYVGQGWADDPDEATAKAARLAERAVTLDPSDARALTLAGHVRGFLGRRPQEACALHDRAIALNPNLALAWCFSGLANAYVGEHQEALRRINQAVRLSPSDPHGFFFDMALIMPKLMLGDYAGAVEAGRRAVEMNPLFSSAYKGYLAALGMLGREQEAAEARKRLLALEPRFNVQDAMLRSPLSRPEDIARYADGLRLAGLPETEADARSGAESAIDLVTQAQHSPSPMRADPHTGRVPHETMS